MERNYKIGQQLVSGILLIGLFILFIQSCTGLSNPPIARDKGLTSTRQILENKEVARKIIDKRFISQGGHVVRFYQ